MKRFGPSQLHFRHHYSPPVNVFYRYYQLALAENSEFAAARIYLERTLKEIE